MMGGGLRRDGPIAIVGSVSIAHFFSHVYLLAFPPLFPLLDRAFDLSTTQLGLLVTAIYLPTLFLQLPLGVVVDRIGAKRVLGAGLLLTAIAIGAASGAPTYPVLLACAFVSGIGQSVFHPADYALLNAVTTPNTEGSAFGVHTFAGYAGFAAAPIVIGGIGIAIDWRLALGVVGAIGVVYAVLFALGIPSLHSGTGDDRPGLDRMLTEMASFLRQWDLLAVAFFYFLSMTAVVGLQSFTTVLATDSYGFGESMANNLLTAHLVATAIAVLLGGPIADRLPVRGVVVTGFLASALGAWIAATAIVGAGLYAAFGIFVLIGLTLGAALPARDTFANETGDPEATGARFGFFFTGTSLGAVIAPAILGWIIDVGAAPLAFAVVGLALVAAASVVTAVHLASTRA